MKKTSLLESLLQYYHLETTTEVIQVLSIESRLLKPQSAETPSPYAIKLKQIEEKLKLEQRNKTLLMNQSYKEICTIYAKSICLLQKAKILLQQKYNIEDYPKQHTTRKSMWILLSGAHNKSLAFPNEYKSLLNMEYPELYKKAIQADVVRTFDGNFPQELRALSNVLRCFAKRNPYIGYCQGFNYFVNFLLTMQFQEQQVFWVLNHLIENILPHSYYSNMIGIAVDIKIIEQYLSIHRPQIASKLVTLQLELSLLCMEWFVCLYTKTLPFCLLKIVWDLLLLHGSIVLLKVALVLLDELAYDIFHANEFACLLMKIKQKKYTLNQESFLQKIRVVYLKQNALETVRTLWSQVLLEAHQPQTNKKQKDQIIHCQVNWPICLQNFKRKRRNQMNNQLWTFREHGNIKLIQNYIDLRLKNKISAYIEVKQISKQLMIARMSHTCKEFNDNAEEVQMTTFMEENYDVIQEQRPNMEHSILSFIKG